MNKYIEWIQENVSSPLGSCRETTEKMNQVFPELRRVRGFYNCFVWGKREHWWLVDPEGNIVDPTVAQFPSKGTGEYIELDETEEEPTGKCINCGGYTYHQNCFCSDACADECANEINCSRQNGLTSFL